jgi:hypothetical protein
MSLGGSTYINCPICVVPPKEVKSSGATFAKLGQFQLVAPILQVTTNVVLPAFLDNLNES